VQSSRQHRMNPTDNPTFTSTEEEAKYWKEKAGEWRQAAADAKEELDEFQEGSRELEAELEQQLEQAENKNKELKALSNKLQLENENLRDKLEQCTREYHSQISELETELSEIKGIKEKLNRYVRELEQQNDDLERAKRSTLASLEDFEGRMNAAIERNAFLESELDEKENLKAAVQRLKDETRDLRSELKVLNPQLLEEEPDNDKNVAMNGSLDSNKIVESTEGKVGQDHQDGGGSAVKPAVNGFSSQPGSVTSPPLTPSARISALGIVGDLLRKVGALELKLVSCRNIVKENGKENADKNGFSSLNSIDSHKRQAGPRRVMSLKCFKRQKCGQYTLIDKGFLFKNNNKC